MIIKTRKECHYTMFSPSLAIHSLRYGCDPCKVCTLKLRSNDLPASISKHTNVAYSVICVDKQ